MFHNTSLKMNDSNLSEYEKTINRNIMSMREQLHDLVESVEKNVAVLTADKKRKRTAEQPKPERSVTPKLRNYERPTLVRRSARHLKNKETPNYNEESDNEGETNRLIRGSLCIKFPWFKSNGSKKQVDEYYNALPNNGDEDEIYEQWYNYDEPRSKKRRGRNTKVETPRLSVSQVTDEMLENIEYNSSNKKYSDKGTTCHQCRQKTLDQKSYCRYKGCRGVRGMFCGFCLGKRYGENVADVLKNPKWACPPCRGICNCSICRRREGRDPTGQLAQFASSRGFKSVRHLLITTEGENTENNSNSESENGFVDDEDDKNDKDNEDDEDDKDNDDYEDDEDDKDNDDYEDNEMSMVIDKNDLNGANEGQNVIADELAGSSNADIPKSSEGILDAIYKELFPFH
ncbi:Zinc-finger domain of monoamine-oxidase A repressor R1 [Cinara cedri]|uniref:Zinc-finger domain of monoamine-oxidase A repressor R1 n=1 Tax=Cinara cedri TaxID=506608 RepID=A0A5E4NLQ0_9HEMI|nr:Zinc-finger domain of monoamine-oxidase A repressor R1 [Cinara cedri]